jgi:hypothetical protein
MWHVYTHRAEAKEKGLIASRTIPAMCDWSVVVRSLFERLRDSGVHNGEMLWAMAQSCKRDADAADREAALRLFA